ncbi:ABC transporter permease [Pseudonocardia pini]|uniref:ABC transporter permease n=1 Tax=Pseudonocardia pini TaxID=2758030 RepID=UPI0015F11DE2|nr:ABC transporter permease [Pseudonocardia pini]
MSVPTAVVVASPRPRRAIRSETTRWLLAVPAAVVVLVAIVGPALAPYDPTRVIGPPGREPFGRYALGTDSAGLDVLSRVLVATRTNLLIALAVVLAATLVGLVLGAAIGMNESRRGPLGTLARAVNRFVDLFTAVPAVIVGLVAVAFFGGTVTVLVVVIAVVLAPIQVRLVRTEVLRVRGEAYLEAARMAGFSELRLTVRHVLPNSWGAVSENMPVIFGMAVVLTAALGFIGVGLPRPTPEWGSMISLGASDAATGRWWAAAFPALALIVTVAAASALGTALRARRA